DAHPKRLFNELLAYSFNGAYASNHTFVISND
ncbi:unnamed protein product, partial [marine sediment metagenome]